MPASNWAAFTEEEKYAAWSNHYHLFEHAGLHPMEYVNFCAFMDRLFG